MLNNIFEPHLSNLTRSMSKTTQRYGMLSNNLANINTPGYQRQDMDFGIELSQAQGMMGQGSSPSGQSAKTGPMRRDGSTVNLETEVSSLAETETRYRLLTEMTNRYFTGMKSVIREGK